MLSGAFRERLWEAALELKENYGRAILQTLGVILGVASVLGGFSISDSFRRRSEELFAKVGGMEKLNVNPSAVVRDGRPTALQAANLGLRAADSREGSELDPKTVQGVSVRKMARTRLRSPFADQDRAVTGVAEDFIPMEGYEVEQGRAFSSTDLQAGAPVVILGTEAASAFFPSGDVVGQILRVGDTPCTVIGVFKDRFFEFRKGNGNAFAWRNRIVAAPATFVQQRLQGDAYQRVDRVTFKIPDVGAMAGFSGRLSSLLKANHRQQQDFRLDDMAARMRKQESQSKAYNVIFLLSGVLALLGGGIVNVNIQMASLKERIREVGVKMAIGAPGREIFKTFLTEALLLTGCGAILGFLIGAAFSWIICASLGVPLYMEPASFLWAFVLALVFGFAFALYPAWKASRLSPMEALRYE